MKDPKDKITQEFSEFPEMEGDFTYMIDPSEWTIITGTTGTNEIEWFEREPDFMGRLDDGRVSEAYEESHFHFTLMAFEDLLSEHGLPYLLDHMSKDAAYELLHQAKRLSHD